MLSLSLITPPPSLPPLLVPSPLLVPALSLRSATVRILPTVVARRTEETEGPLPRVAVASRTVMAEGSTEAVVVDVVDVAGVVVASVVDGAASRLPRLATR